MSRIILWKLRIVGFMIVILAGVSIPKVLVQAKYAAKPVNAKTNTTMEKLTRELQLKIVRTTPKEPTSSDLVLIHGAARLATRRIPQGYTYDGSCYYFLSCISFYGKEQNDLRLTRIKYRKDGTYKEDYMTLKGFGHGTNLDCVVYQGKTWLWTGSDPVNGTGPTTSISCFRFQKGKTLKKHAKIHYTIPLSGKGKYAANCFPAINAAGTCLAVRYSSLDKQCFRLFKLKKGRYIDNRHPFKSFNLNVTKGDFQGFDIQGTNLYTIEGSASRAERKELHKTYYPIKIRKYNYKTGRKTVITVKGAKKLSHREPEGIQVDGKGRIEFGLASHYKDEYTCMNIYRYRSGKK